MLLTESPVLPQSFLTVHLPKCCSCDWGRGAVRKLVVCLNIALYYVGTAWSQNLQKIRVNLLTLLSFEVNSVTHIHFPELGTPPTP